MGLINGFWPTPLECLMRQREEEFNVSGSKLT